MAANAPSGLSFESQTNCLDSDYNSALEDREHDSDETRERKAKERGVKENMKEVGHERGVEFRRQLQTTCADEETESEEDPDPEPEEEAVLSEASSDGGESQDDDLDDTQDTIANPLNPDNPDNFKAQVAEYSPQPIISATDPADTVRVWTVYKQLIILGITHLPVKQNMFTEFTEADNLAQEYAQHWRSREKTLSFMETFDEHDRCRKAVASFSKIEEYDCVKIWVERGYMSTGQAEETFGVGRIKKKVAEKSWFIHTTVTTKDTNPETGEITLHTTTNPNGPWTDMYMANHEASNMMMKLTAPTVTPHLDYMTWLETHENEVSKEIRNHCETVRVEKQGFDITVTIDKDSCPWLMKQYVEISLKVQLHRTKGPLN